MLTQLPENRRSRRLHRWRPLVLSLAFSLSVLRLVASDSIKINTGDAFPSLADFKLEGKLPDSTKGKVVLIDFWASWCGPCKQSFPVMEDLHKRYSGRGLVIIAISVDSKRPAMEAFLKKNEVSFTVMRDPGQQLVERTGVTAMPSSFLIDREGKVRFIHTGFRGAETRRKYEEQIESLLK